MQGVGTKLGTIKRSVSHARDTVAWRCVREGGSDPTRVTPDMMGAAQGLLGDGGLVLHNGVGTAALNFGGALPAETQLGIKAALGAATPGVPTHNVSDVARLDWSQPGSGTVTRDLLASMRGLPETTQSALEKAAQYPAGQLQALYAQKARSLRTPVRDDLQNFLGIVKQKGWRGLLQQGLDSGAYLPAVGAIGVGGLLGQRPAPLP